jgi:hypothetical protein
MMKRLLAAAFVLALSCDAASAASCYVTEFPLTAAAVYGGAVITLPTPLRQPTTATALFCANVTTGASTKVSAVGYKGA